MAVGVRACSSDAAQEGKVRHRCRDKDRRARLRGLPDAQCFESPHRLLLGPEATNQDANIRAEVATIPPISPKIILVLRTDARLSWPDRMYKKSGASSADPDCLGIVQAPGFSFSYAGIRLNPETLRALPGRVSRQHARLARWRSFPDSRNRNAPTAANSPAPHRAHAKGPLCL